MPTNIAKSAVYNSNQVESRGQMKNLNGTIVSYRKHMRSKPIPVGHSDVVVGKQRVNDSRLLNNSRDIFNSSYHNYNPSTHLITPSNSKHQASNNLGPHPEFTTLDPDDNAGRPLDYADSASALLPREQTGESISVQGYHQAARHKSAVRGNHEVAKGLKYGDLRECRKSDIQSLQIVR